MYMRACIYVLVSRAGARNKPISLLSLTAVDTRGLYHVHDMVALIVIYVGASCLDSYLLKSIISMVDKSRSRRLLAM